MLSEEAVLGFEYGYSLATPKELVIWEAQFGDFANNAQSIIDQFVVSGEAKWQRQSGLVMLLPHGFEGQGPEHSSARLERYLQLCAENNIQVCQPTTPAQHFHLLRRQVLSNFRKPLIVMTPKSLLRNPKAVSGLQELTSGSFREVLDDDFAPTSPRRVLLCSGKIYYDLVERRQANGGIDAAIVRLEQFYPFPRESLSQMIARYKGAEEWVWVQDEPQNMGGWNFVRSRLEGLLQRELGYVGRAASASTATGYHSMHAEQQSVITETALGLRERKISALQ
jgi:2-oxoglutarate dehydrogenase E1 component